MQGRSGLILGVAMVKGSTASYTCGKVVAVRLKGRYSHLTPGENLIKDAWSSTGTQHQFHDIADSQSNTDHARVYQTHNILPEGNACSSFSPAWVLLDTNLFNDPCFLNIDPFCRTDVDLDVPTIAVIG
jgi:hypothetical protein